MLRAAAEKETTMFIRTERLFLRPAWREDAPALTRAIGNWEVVKNLGRVPWPYSLGDAEAFIAGRSCAPRETSFLIFVRDPEGLPTLAGGIGFGRFCGFGDDIEIGYWLAPEWQRRGMVVEAARAVLELAFLGLRLPRLRAGHFVDNPASGKVLRKLGFQPTGEAGKHPCLARGDEIESVEYLLTAEQWHRGRSELKEAA